jgi:hypothetical protein
MFAGALVLVTVLGLLPAAEAGALHTAKGVVLSVDPRAGRIVMTHEDAQGSHVLVVNLLTQIVDEAGALIPMGALQPGDLVREQCVPNGSNPSVATRISVLRPAWKDLASPEM